MGMKKFIVITTINPKSNAIFKFEEKKDWHVVVVGDKKSSPLSSSDNLTFLSVQDQLNLDFQFTEHCPFNHYSRKNIGYLYSIQHGADIIYDTDDDNYPNEEWSLPDFSCHHLLESPGKFVNIYQYFTREFIWPRGFPIDEIQNERKNQYPVKISEKVKIGTWQGLTDGEPDIDAVYRMIINCKNITFEKKSSVYLEKGHFCPINSQNTFWSKDTFPYLYLPATVNFRFTDILRGYIAQYLMWKKNLYVGYTHATVYQKRNPHDLMLDYKNESSMYINIKDIINRLGRIPLGTDPLDNVEKTYQELLSGSYVDPQEIELLKFWIQDYKRFEWRPNGKN